MCFSIPFKVLKIQKNNALIEGGLTVKLGKELKVKIGDYLQIVGDVAQARISKTQGLKIRKLIKSLSK